MTNNLYKICIFAGVALVIIGAGIFILQRLHIPLGRLPGDIVISKGNFRLYFPIMTCIIISVVVSIVFYLWKR